MLFRWLDGDVPCVEGTSGNPFSPRDRTGAPKTAACLAGKPRRRTLGTDKSIAADQGAREGTACTWVATAVSWSTHGRRGARWTCSGHGRATATALAPATAETEGNMGDAAIEQSATETLAYSHRNREEEGGGRELTAGVSEQTSQRRRC